MLKRCLLSASLSEELQEYIYKSRSVRTFEIHCLTNIDPYTDTILEYKKIDQIMEVCESIIESDFLRKYDYEDDAMNTFIQLKTICKKAIADNKSIIAVGD